MSGIYAALWLIGLLAAAPALRTRPVSSLADRLRDALVLGVAIPLGLAFVHALYPATCWIALALCVVVAVHRRVPNLQRPAPVRLPYILIAALALVAWPPLMRPVLDSDSLSYHLPNAAAWVHAHGFWTTDPRYWWYPPASESFAAGLFAVSGPYAVGWSGLGAMTLLGFRLYEWTRQALAATPWVADALAAATVTAAPLAIQAGTLQNDVWLAAFFLEALWTLRCEPSAAPRTIAVTVLLKPYGWIFALVAAMVSRAPRAVWLTGAGALALWIAHDVVLWHVAIVAPASTSSANTWQTTILSHGAPALALLVRVALFASPFALLAMLAAFAGPLFARGDMRVVGWAALAAFVVFLIMPLAYADWHPQLETGDSLRYAAPAIAIGALLLARPASRAPFVAGALFLLSTVFGAASVLAIYWNDGGTRIALIIAVLTVANAIVARAAGTRWPLPAGLAAAVIVAVYLAARHPVDYYADALGVGGKTSGLYAWVARTPPPAIGGWGLRIGVVNVLAPSSRTIDLPEATPCATARREAVALVAVAENDRAPAFNAHRLSVARACMQPLQYDDGLAVVSGRGGM